MLTIKQLFWCNAFLGSNKKNWNNNMSIFVIGIKSDIYIINLNYTLFLFFKALNFLKCFIQTKKRIIFYLPKLNNLSIFNFILNISKWIFGMLTNVNALYNSKSKSNIYIKGFPSLIVIFHNKDYVSIINECLHLDIPIIGFADTSQNPLYFDYPIPTNSNSSEFIYFYYKIIISYIKILLLKSQKEFFNSIIIKNKIK